METAAPPTSSFRRASMRCKGGGRVKQVRRSGTARRESMITCRRSNSTSLQPRRHAVATETKNGKVGVLKLKDPNPAVVCQASLRQAIGGAAGRRGPNRRRLAIRLNQKGERLYFVKVQGSERLMGWMGCRGRDQACSRPTFTESLTTGPYVGTQPAAGSDHVCFRGPSLLRQLGAPAADHEVLTRRPHAKGKPLGCSEVRVPSRDASS